MRAGVKDRRVDLQVLTITQSATGAPSESWALFRTIWAQLTYLPATARLAGDEKFSADQIAAEIWTIFKINYIPNLTPKSYRLVYNGTVFDIRHVVEVGRREALELRCVGYGV